MEPNSLIMSGPHQGQTLYLSVSSPEIEIRMHDDARPGIDCRYSRRDGDPLVGGLTQLHYLGDILAQA